MHVSSKPLSCSDFFPELQSAITDNCEVLRKCKESKLSYNEMECFGKNPRQCRACFGVLFEAEINGEVYCFKKPILSVCCQTLNNLCHLSPIGSCAIKYEAFDDAKKVIGYRKVPYNRLSYQALRCKTS